MSDAPDSPMLTLLPAIRGDIGETDIIEINLRPGPLSRRLDPVDAGEA